MVDLKIEQHQDKFIIILDKNVVIGSDVAVIQNSVLDLIKNGTKNIAVDLSQLDCISCWGIGTLLHTLNICKNCNVNFYLTGVNEKILEILSKLKLQQIFKIQKINQSPHFHKSRS